MPDVDPLAFDIRFALKHQAIGESARKFVRLLPDRELGYLCREIANHLRRSRWATLPPEPLATTSQGPMASRKSE